MPAVSETPIPKDWAVIFDLDGLLADTEPLWAEASRLLLHRRGLVYDPSLKPYFMGRHPLEVMTRMIEHYKLKEEPKVLMRERLQILRSLYEQAIRPLPGARELVRALTASAVPQSVASGSPTEIVELVLRKLDLYSSFQQIVGSDVIARGKPAPDLFLLAAQRMKIVPSVCVVLEDSVAGVQAALSAGMKCIAVPSPETPLAEIANADLIVQSLLELSPSILGKLVKPSAP